MANKRTKASSYESKYGGGWVTGTQYLAEMMCARKSQIIDKKELPLKFWKSPLWQKEFKTQSMIARKLIAEFDIELIFKVLRTNRGKSVYSLGAPWVKEMIQEEKSKELKIEIEEVKEVVSLPLKPQFISKNNIFSKLKKREENE